jgi:hypothetical protein
MRSVRPLLGAGVHRQDPRRRRSRGRRGLPTLPGHRAQGRFLVAQPGHLRPALLLQNLPRQDRLRGCQHALPAQAPHAPGDPRAGRGRRHLRRLSQPEAQDAADDLLQRRVASWRDAGPAPEPRSADAAVCLSARISVLRTARRRRLRPPRLPSSAILAACARRQRPGAGKAG